MEARGHVFKYGDNVDTDVIIPARYLNSFDPQELLPMPWQILILSLSGKYSLET